MDYREQAKFLIDQISESKLPYVVHFLMGATIPDSSDDAYCEQLLKEYQNDPDPHKADAIPLEQLAREVGLSSDENK